MNTNKILSLAYNFEKKAKEEKIPPKTSNLEEVLKNLQSLETFQARTTYAEKNLKHLSSGSSRIVFDIGKNRVLKLATNEKGISQNKAEAEIESDCKYINKVTKKAKNYSWIIAPLGEKLTEREFFDLTNIVFKEFAECIKYSALSKDYKDMKKPESFEEIEKEDIFKDISKIVDKYDLASGDVARISSWKVKNKTPILVDLGLTNEIYKSYYAKKK